GGHVIDFDGKTIEEVIPDDPIYRKSDVIGKVEMFFLNDRSGQVGCHGLADADLHTGYDLGVQIFAFAQTPDLDGTLSFQTDRILQRRLGNDQNAHTGIEYEIERTFIVDVYRYNDEVSFERSEERRVGKEGRSRLSNGH